MPPGFPWNRRSISPEDSLGLDGLNQVIAALDRSERLNAQLPIAIIPGSLVSPRTITIEDQTSAAPVATTISVRLTGFEAGKYSWTEVYLDQATGEFLDLTGGKVGTFESDWAIEINGLADCWDPTPGVKSFARIVPSEGFGFYRFYQVKSGGPPRYPCTNCGAGESILLPKVLIAEGPLIGSVELTNTGNGDGTWEASILLPGTWRDPTNFCVEESGETTALVNCSYSCQGDEFNIGVTACHGFFGPRYIATYVPGYSGTFYTIDRASNMVLVGPDFEPHPSTGTCDPLERTFDTYPANASDGNVFIDLFGPGPYTYTVKLPTMPMSSRLSDPPLPSLGRQALNFVMAQAKHTVAMRAKSSPETVAERLATCNECPLLRASDRRCSAIGCGCPVDIKATYQSESCPHDKWPVPTPEPIKENS